MNTNEKIKFENRRKHEPSIYTDDPESYEMLCGGYWITLLISGICFMWAFGQLNWLTGIGWFFLSNLISVILVRFEMIFKSNFILWIGNKKRNLFEYWGN